MSMLRSAAFSPCRIYRYALSRVWDSNLPTVLFVGLNPSTADERNDDPTIRRCIGFARRWNLGGLVMVNLFAFRSTRPSILLAAADPVGPANDMHILAAARTAERIVLAWGTCGAHLGRDRTVLAMLPDADCLGTTKHGHPKHPLYLKGNTRLRPFRAARLRRMGCISNWDRHERGI
jgi:hypothetical protein